MCIRVICNKRWRFVFCFSFFFLFSTKKKEYIQRVSERESVIIYILANKKPTYSFDWEWSSCADVKCKINGTVCRATNCRNSFGHFRSRLILQTFNVHIHMYKENTHDERKRDTRCLDWCPKPRIYDMQGYKSWNASLSARCPACNGK